MSNPKVSVIIPCYNVEKYLKQCLDSVVNQTLQDIEIICINDGSTDSTLSILREYENVDNRIKVISKHNSGYGASMNIGLETAKGKYIGIVESDDFVELNMFETLYNEAEVNGLDVVRSNFYLYNSKLDKNDKLDQTWVKHNEIYAPVDEGTPFFQQPSIWANLYNREFLNLNNIRFLETPGASYQDVSFTFKVYACAKRFKMIENAFLHYRIDNANSSINSTNKVYCVCDEYREIEKFVNETNQYEIYKYLIPRIKYACYCWNYNHLAKNLRFKFLMQMSKEYMAHFVKGEVDKNKFSKRDRKRLLIISFVPFVYFNKRGL